MLSIVLGVLAVLGLAACAHWASWHIIESRREAQRLEDVRDGVAPGASMSHSRRGANLRSRHGRALRAFRSGASPGETGTYVGSMLVNLMTADFEELCDATLEHLDRAEAAKDDGERWHFHEQALNGIVVLEEYDRLRAAIVPAMTSELETQVGFLVPVIREYRDKAAARIRACLGRGYPLEAAAARIDECGETIAKLVRGEGSEQEPAVVLLELLNELLVVDDCLLEAESMDACNDGVTRIGAARQRHRLVEARASTHPRIGGFDSRDPLGTPFLVKDENETVAVHWFAARARLRDVAARIAALRTGIADVMAAMVRGPLDPVALCDHLIELERDSRGVHVDVGAFSASLERAHANLPRQISSV